MRRLVVKATEAFAVLTDWLLIVAGLALIVKALLSVDVPVARYAIIGLGLLFFIAGVWYRSRRRRKRQDGTG